MVNQKGVDQLLEVLSETPSLKHLGTKREEENLVGSRLRKQKTFRGKHFYFYEDDSVLVYDPAGNFYHFITLEGREQLCGERKLIDDLVYGITNADPAENIGSGSFSNCYSLDTAGGVVAKTTTAESFVKRELSDVFSEAYDMMSDSDFIGCTMRGKKIIQYMDLGTTLGMLHALKTNGFATPVFYGFSIRINASSEEIQEYQFMERIDRPTLHQIFENSDLSAEQQIHYESVPYAKHLEQVRQYFESDGEMLRALGSAYWNIKCNVKRDIQDIGDIEPNNLFVYDFDPETREFTLMISDPIREQKFIRPTKFFELH